MGSGRAWRTDLAAWPCRSVLLPVAQELPRARSHVLGGEAELGEGFGPGRRCTESIEGDDIVGPALPAERRAGLHGQRWDVVRQHLVLVRLVLSGEQVPRRH